MKKLVEFQKMMREIEERENIFVCKIYAIERRMFTNEHKSDIDFYAVAKERNSEKYRAYYYYTSTMEKPNYVVCYSREDAYKETRETIAKISL